jgi:Domain of unknown function (DUF4342)
MTTPNGSIPEESATTESATTESATTKPRATPKETFKIRGELLVAKVKELIRDGNVRRIVVKNDEGHTVIEIPVTAGVIAAVVAPVVTAVGAIAALANDWRIEVHHTDPETTSQQD